jgi:hypothetical protein
VNPTTATFSPDGRWVVYSSYATTDATGPVYVQPYPATGARYEIAMTAHHPLWSPNGKELFYVPVVGQFFVVSVTTEPSFTFSIPVPVPRGFPLANPRTPRTFDITPDGKFVGVITSGSSQTQAGAPPQIQVVLNWFEELKTRVPVTK